jgi:2-dehydropantoate 2-reductase
MTGDDDGGGVAVVGGGVIGSIFAAHLARVTDVSVLCRREEHAAALERDGLRVTGKHDFAARLRAATSPAALAEPWLAIVATKATALAGAAASLRGHWPRTTVMTVQNGLGAEEVVRRHGDWALLSAVTFVSGTKHADTHVEYILDTETWIGPYESTPVEVAERAGGLFDRSGLKVEVMPDLRPAQWSKLIFNATVNGVAALTGLRHDFHFASEDEESDLGHLVHGLIDEGKEIARAAGIELHDDPWEMNVLATRRGSAHYPSMLEDVDSRRPTEVELINGALVREARERGVEAPLHTALFRLVKAREASYT